MPEEDFHLSVHARLQAHESGSSASGRRLRLRLEVFVYERIGRPL